MIDNYLDNYIWQYVTIYSYNIFIIYNYTKKYKNQTVTKPKADPKWEPTCPN